MTWSSDALDIALSAVSELPGGGAIVRLLDKWGNDARLGKLEADIQKLFDRFSGSAPVGPQVADAIQLAIDRNEPDISLLRKAGSCLVILRALNTESKMGRMWDPDLHREKAVTLIGSLANTRDPVAELRATVYELKRADLIFVEDNFNAPPHLPWECLGPSQSFFSRTDVIFQSWNPAADAKEICRRARPAQGYDAAELDQALKWGPRRFNPAADYALRRRWTRVPYESASSSAYVLPWAWLTEEGEFFLEND